MLAFHQNDLTALMQVCKKNLQAQMFYALTWKGSPTWKGSEATALYMTYQLCFHTLYCDFKPCQRKGHRPALSKNSIKSLYLVYILHV